MNNFRLRILWPNDTLVTLVGTGISGLSGDGGAAFSAQINPGYSVPIIDPISAGLIFADMVSVSKALRYAYANGIVVDVFRERC